MTGGRAFARTPLARARTDSSVTLVASLSGSANAVLAGQAPWARLTDSASSSTTAVSSLLRQTLRSAALPRSAGPSPNARGRPVTEQDQQRADALLIAGHLLTPEQVARVRNLVDSLGLPGRDDARRLAWLAARIGLHRQDGGAARTGRGLSRAPDVARVLRFLDLASEVFDHGQVSLAQLTSLRRLADLIAAERARPGGAARPEATLADLEDEARFHSGRQAGAAVPREDLRRLVTMTGEAKADLLAARRGGLATRLGLAGGGVPVRRADLGVVARGHAAQAARAIRMDRFLNGSLPLTVAEQRELIEAMLTGPERYRDPAPVLRLLELADKDQAGALAADGSLVSIGGQQGLLDQAIPVGHPRRPALEQMLADQYGGQPRLDLGIVRPTGPDARPFDPARIPGLDAAGIGPGELSGALSGEQIRQLNAALGDRSDAEIVAAIGPLPPLQLARARWWVAGVRAAAGLVTRAEAYVAGTLRLTAGQLRELSYQLLAGSMPYHDPGTVLRVLNASGDGQLGAVFARSDDGEPAGSPVRQLHEWLESAGGDSRLLGDELARLHARFNGGRTALAAGLAQPTGERNGVFQPAKLSPRLAEAGVSERAGRLSGAQIIRAARIVAGLPAAAVTDALSRLPGVEAAVGRTWVSSLSHLARMVARAEGHLTGVPERTVPAAELRLAAGLLLAGALPYRDPETVLRLAEHSDDDELDALFAGRVVPQRLVNAIGELREQGNDHGLADRLDRLREQRYPAAGWDDVIAGRVRASGQPPRPFSPASSARSWAASRRAMP